MISESELLERVVGVRPLSLLLDYDGTLAEFAPTPDDIEPNREVIEILEMLRVRPGLSIGIVSGRRLSAVETLLPVAGITIAGSYGVELKFSDGSRVEQLTSASVRPTLDRLKPRWEEMIAGRTGFFLEDKRWSLALHGRFASEEDAERVFDQAMQWVEREGIPQHFRVLGGERFLEIAPRAADKGRAVDRLIAGPHRALAGFPLYFGDDDKDLEAFAVVHRHGGYTALVGERYPEAAADCRFAGPRAVRSWLRRLANRLAPA